MTTDPSFPSWTALNKEFKESMGPPADYGGGLCGAPLQPARVAIIGMNWRSVPVLPQHVRWHDTLGDYPPKCLLTEKDHSGTFGVGVCRILASALRGPKTDVTAFIEQKTFWTNRVLVSTPAVTRDYGPVLRRALMPSAVAVKKMLAVVKPGLILCFGNSEIGMAREVSPSRFILSECAGLGSAWPADAVEQWELDARRGWIGFFRNLTLKIDGIRLVAGVWSIPHPSRDRTEAILACKPAMDLLADCLI